MKKKYITRIFYIILSLVIIECISSNRYIDPQPNFEDVLSNAITVKAESEKIIDMASLTSFKWDTMYIFDPYTTFEKIRKTLKLDKGIHFNTGITASDSIHLLVFLYKGNVVKYLDFSRRKGDFLSEDNIDITKALFKIKVNQGSPLPFYLEKVKSDK